jgi:hypothetical protein
MAAMLRSIMATIVTAASFGRKSAIQTIVVS